MTLKSYLNAMATATMVAFMGWVLVLLYIDPTNSGYMGLILFYTTLFLGLVGLFTLFSFSLKRWIGNNEIIFAYVASSFRQGFFLAVIVVGLLVMQGARILNWWDALLFVGAVALLELYFISE
ncbi:MAG: hypothetical protein FJZ04_01780 [Candidatus Moranbacteria bacterium]|nr:hypothetical protein [Candidatus Moranbacteria bacterium]